MNKKAIDSIWKWQKKKSNEDGQEIVGGIVSSFQNLHQDNGRVE